MNDAVPGLSSSSTQAVIDAFNDAFNHHDVDAMMALMTDDCVFETTSPAPNGARYEGQADVRQFWADFFARTPSARFDTEEIFTAGNRGVVRWRYSWREPDEPPGHVRGVDVFLVRDGRVAEKLSYVKG